jgi:hypothetical protein
VTLLLALAAWGAVTCGAIAALFGVLAADRGPGWMDVDRREPDRPEP